MSNHAPPPPPPPPGAPAPPPAAAPPPASAPPPGYNPNPGGPGGGAKAGMPTWAKVGIGCGCLALLAIVAGFMLLGWGAKKAVEAVSDPASIAELAIKAHPDYDLVETDRDGGTITIREKATDKVQTFDFSDIANGNFSMEGSDGEKFEIGAEAGGIKVTDSEGNESTIGIETSEGEGMRITSSDGSEVRIGGGAEAPSWVPLYPGAQFDGGTSFVSNGEANGGVAAESIDASLEEVEKWYQDHFEQNFNCNVERSSFDMGGNKTVILTCKDGDRSVNASVTEQEGRRSLAVNYSGPAQ
ncbi:MAG: hypothetical protein AAGM22_04360 [Acidobacteriota bacterium]